LVVFFLIIAQLMVAFSVV